MVEKMRRDWMRYLALIGLLALLGCAQQPRDLPSSAISSPSGAQFGGAED
jgi:hypothetical protein